MEESPWYPSFFSGPFEVGNYELRIHIQQLHNFAVFSACCIQHARRSLFCRHVFYCAVHFRLSSFGVSIRLSYGSAAVVR